MPIFIGAEFVSQFSMDDISIFYQYDKFMLLIRKDWLSWQTDSNQDHL